MPHPFSVVRTDVLVKLIKNQKVMKKQIDWLIAREERKQEASQKGPRNYAKGKR